MTHGARRQSFYRVGLPCVLKGIMSPEDAALAVQHGVVRVLETLDEEMRVSMGLLGVTSVDKFNKFYMRPAHPTTLPAR